MKKNAQEKLEKPRCYIGIDNGKAGAVAIISAEGKVLDILKYDPKDTLASFKFLSAAIGGFDAYGFIEEPIVVHGMAHQMSPFETFGRHRMALEILGVTYRTGSPSHTAEDNWKNLISLKASADNIIAEHKEEIRERTKDLRAVLQKAELMGYKAKNIKTKKKSYRCPEEQKLQEEYMRINKVIGTLKDSRSTGIKNLSVDTCLAMFPDAVGFISRVNRNRVLVYDHDKAEALLLAECARRVFVNEK